jgi:hypothetical protein
MKFWTQRRNCQAGWNLSLSSSVSDSHETLYRTLPTWVTSRTPRVWFIAKSAHTTRQRRAPCSSFDGAQKPQAINLVMWQGELSLASIDRGWPYQVALPARFCERGGGYKEIYDFCDGPVSLAWRWLRYSFVPANAALRCQSNKAERSSWADDDGIVGADS